MREAGETAAQEVLDGLARQVGDREGSPLWRTSLRDKDPWRPTVAEVERIAGLAAQPELDPAAAWCLGKILARYRVRSTDRVG